MNLPPDWDWEALNNCYIRESGMESKPFLSKEFAWGNWSKHGFNEADLVQVLRYLRKQVKAGQRKPASMLFRNLIEYPENFEQELCLSKEAIINGKRSESPKAAILRATGRPTQPEQPARPVGQVIRNDKAFEAFREQMKAEGLL